MRKWLDKNFGIEKDSDGDDFFKFRKKDSQRDTEVRLDVFLSLFGEVVTPPAFKGFIDADPDNKSGWHDNFERWKELGIIK